MVFTKYEKTKYIFIFLSLFICLYFSCTVTLVPDCAVFFVILIEIISFLWIQFYLISFLYIQFFAFQTYFGLFYRVSFSAIFRWRTNQSRGIISFLRMWSFLGWNLTVIFVSYVGFYLRDAPWRKTKRSCHNSGSNWEIDTDCPCTRIFSKRNFY